MENNRLTTSELSVIASDLTITGTVEVTRELHVHGKIIGELIGKPGSSIQIKESSHVEGKVFAETLIIDGFVRGEIEATQKIWITARGRVLGSVKTPSLQVDSGATFEAKVKM
jgi:cytoskeletal protein CcmA (bactofilin family)